MLHTIATISKYPTRLELWKTVKNVMPSNVKLKSLIESPEKVVLRGFEGHSESQCTGFLSGSLVYNSIGRATVYKSKFNVI